MGTRFEVFLRGRDEEHLEAIAVAVLDEIVRLGVALSRFDPRSEIARVNRDAHRRPVRVDHEVFALLARCERAREMTEGYFDATASTNAGEKSRPDLRLDAGERTVHLTRPDALVDLGGVGKGYALDRGREIISRFGGVQSGLLHGGTSSVLAIGGEAGWPIDLRHPRRPDVIVGRVELIERALSCSAARHADQRTSDVINPLTGEPLSGRDACVTLAASAADAEIFSTGLLVMDRERAAQFLKSHADAEMSVGWVNDDGLSWLESS